MRPLALLLALLLSTAYGAAHADTLTGRATVIDGDTIELHGERIRLLDIDAPESRQTCGDPPWRCGQMAAWWLAAYLEDEVVTCEISRRDRYARWLARCRFHANGHTVDLSILMAGDGMAVPYRDCRCEDVRAAADEARAAGRGIHAGTYVEPWLWRKGER